MTWHSFHVLIDRLQTLFKKFQLQIFVV